MFTSSNRYSFPRDRARENEATLALRKHTVKINDSGRFGNNVVHCKSNHAVHIRFKGRIKDVVCTNTAVKRRNYQLPFELRNAHCVLINRVPPRIHEYNYGLRIGEI